MIKIQPSIDTALQHHSAGRLLEAETAYRKVLVFDPDNIDALHFLGVIAYQRGEHEQAMELISHALFGNASNAPAQNNLGNVFAALEKFDEAIACFQKALAIKPDYADANVNLGAALTTQGKLVEAMACYQKVLTFRPDYPEVHFYLGNILRGQGELDEAIVCYQKALALKLDFPEAYQNMGNTFTDLGLTSEAIGCYQKALSINPGYAEARWGLAMSQIPVMYEENADPGFFRTKFSAELDNLDRWFDSTRVAGGFIAVGTQQPFCLAYQEQNNRDLLWRYGRLCTGLMAEWFDSQVIVQPRRRNIDGIIRVGVVSQYFRNHSVWNAIVKGWFQQIDRRRFALHAFYLGTDCDQETLIAQSRAAHFEQGARGLRQWVETIVDSQLDVLLYPEIGMDPMTARLASLRLAPIQVATWGHPETTGLPTIDYYLSAADMEPENAQGNYTEQLVTLPHLGCFCESQEIISVCPDLDSLGISLEAPLLICPGVPFKYAPQYDWVLTEIAHRLGQCQFVFFTHRISKLSEKLKKRLESVFNRRRLDIDKFVTFIPWQNRSEFYGLLQRADVFLDTIGFSGFNTAMQAVGCSLPIVTREGDFLRGRLASGILKRMGMQDLIADSEQAYVELAVRLVRDAEFRERTRKRIEVSRYLIFEDIAPIRALEDFLAEVTVRR